MGHGTTPLSKGSEEKEKLILLNARKKRKGRLSSNQALHGDNSMVKRKISKVNL